MTLRSTTKLAALGAITTLFLFGIVSIPTASAATSIICLDMDKGGLDVTDIAPADLGDTISCFAATTRLDIEASVIIAESPTGSEVTLNSESGVGSNAIASGEFDVDEAGVWEVEALFFDANGVLTETELINIAVSFLVIPESPIGVAALVGSSLAALGGYVGLRRFRASPSIKPGQI